MQPEYTIKKYYSFHKYLLNLKYDVNRQQFIYTYKKLHFITIISNNDFFYDFSNNLKQLAVEMVIVNVASVNVTTRDSEVIASASTVGVEVIMKGSVEVN